MVEVKEIISKLPVLQIRETITYEAIINSRDDAYLEHLVKDSIIRQLSEHLYKNLTPTILDTHKGREYHAQTYFFTRTELLQLAEQLYNKGFQRRETTLSNFTSQVNN